MSEKYSAKKGNVLSTELVGHTKVLNPSTLQLLISPESKSSKKIVSKSNKANFCVHTR